MDYTLPALVDFEVRIPKGGHTNALTECVITWDCGHEIRKTRGVHVNQVFSGIMATIKLINIQLHEMATATATRANLSKPLNNKQKNEAL